MPEEEEEEKKTPARVEEQKAFNILTPEVRDQRGCICERLV